jgi:hypothetical protein
MIAWPQSMTKEDKDILDNISRLSDSILQIATKNNNIEDINDLEITRADYIANFFSKPVKSEDSKDVARVIKNVIKINEQITAALEKRKQLISTELNKFKTSKKATNAYLSNL